jgi:hypothetical protein
MMHWLRENTAQLAWALGLSGLLFIAALVAVPLLIVRLPADYFRCRNWRERHIAHRRHPVVHVALVVARNLLGILFILAGVGMLVLPGQGILSIVIGLVLTDVPGKFRFARWIVGRPVILDAINRLRARAGRAPLEIPHCPDE